MTSNILSWHTLGLHPPQTKLISTFPYDHQQTRCRSFRILKLRQRVLWQRLGMKCGGGDGPEVKLQKDEAKREECDEKLEMDNIEDVNEKVELMEMEAIMGKDDGREAMDYKRRAGIFYKSSELFQANKEKQHHCT